MAQSGGNKQNTCCSAVLWVIHAIIVIVAISKAHSSGVTEIDGGTTRYLVLPIISLIIPNPITTAITAFADCEEFKNCGEGYRSLFMFLFVYEIIGVALVCCLPVFCTGLVCCAACAAAAKDEEAQMNDYSREDYD